MLVLTRKAEERITIGGGVELVVLSVRGSRVRLGVTAPAETTISRGPAINAARPDSTTGQPTDVVCQTM